MSLGTALRVMSRLLLHLGLVWVLGVVECTDASAQNPEPLGNRKVTWFTSGGAWPVGTDGLNLSQWVATHRNAITGTMPCCGCWNVLANGTFMNSGRCASATGYTPNGDPNRTATLIADWRAVTDAGLTIEPTGGFTTEFLRSEAWMIPGSLGSAVELLRREGWDGLCIDNEDYPPTMPPDLPAHFANLLGNLSRAVAAANKTLVVDVTSTWTDDIGGAKYLAGYGCPS